MTEITWNCGVHLFATFHPYCFDILAFIHQECSSPHLLALITWYGISPLAITPSSNPVINKIVFFIITILKVGLDVSSDKKGALPILDQRFTRLVSTAAPNDFVQSAGKNYTGSRWATIKFLLILARRFCLMTWTKKYKAPGRQCM